MLIYIALIFKRKMRDELLTGVIYFSSIIIYITFVVNRVVVCEDTLCEIIDLNLNHYN